MTGRRWGTQHEVLLLRCVLLSSDSCGIRVAGLGWFWQSIVPYQMFRSSDGFFMCGALNDRQFSKLCAALGRPELSKEPRFLRNKDRVTHRCCGSVLC
jgi:succinate--hydroxymethylglutarate CoA-transferase